MNNILRRSLFLNAVKLMDSFIIEKESMSRNIILYVFIYAKSIMTPQLLDIPERPRPMSF